MSPMRALLLCVVLFFTFASVKESNAIRSWVSKNHSKRLKNIKRQKKAVRKKSRGKKIRHRNGDKFKKVKLATPTTDKALLSNGKKTWDYIVRINESMRSLGDYDNAKRRKSSYILAWYSALAVINILPVADDHVAEELLSEVMYRNGETIKLPRKPEDLERILVVSGFEPEQAKMIVQDSLVPSKDTNSKFQIQDNALAFLKKKYLDF